jgi:hypothetical protein
MILDDSGGLSGDDTMSSDNAMDGVFTGKDPEVRAVYEALVSALRMFGTIKEAPKQTSIHLEKNSGFAGVHPRKSYLNLEFRTDYKIDDPRIVRQQQLSARRIEHTVRLATAADIDGQLLAWLKDAYALSK